MNHQPVKSSHISSAGYDPDTKTLEVIFKKGSVYRYHDVPEALYRAMMEAELAGKFLNENIIGVYREERIDGGPVPAGEDKSTGASGSGADIEQLQDALARCGRDCRSFADVSDDYNRFVAENNDLRSKIEALRKENDKLRAEIKKLGGSATCMPVWR